MEKQTKMVAAASRNALKRIIRLSEVMSITGMPRASIYQQIDEGVFPRQIPLGRRSVGWLESEIYNWIDQRISLR